MTRLIDSRSIKVIDRTVIPVIKFATKDARSRSLQLDISFDSRGHHGMESVDMIKSTMEKFPMICPIVLVLKQFLLDKGLLTAYTGGLSSHCLFLMLTRYLQEQTSASWVDAGSLLMGCLDFYGNGFDPRMVGITVTNAGQYFRRPHYQQISTYQQGSFNDEVSRSRSFQDHDSVTMSNNPSTFGFDPLYVEDPISIGNNVGRNSFRINQVQRAFSDTHRALVASLEWDMNGSDLHETKYPLLKSLLPKSYNSY
eukprot:scaffold530_cov223-Chaetoceros_neogracile.AAC.2